MTRSLLPLSLLLSMALLLAGCASMGEVTQLPPEVRAADQMLASGHPRDAARSYAAQAMQAQGSLRDLLGVRAADAWQQAGDPAAAKRAFADVNSKHLSGDDALRYRLLEAEFAVASHHPAIAVGNLDVPDASVPPSLRTRWRHARFAALEASGDKFGAAGQLALLEASQGKKEQAATRARIHKLLAGVDDATLARGAAALPAGDPLYPYAGRMLVSRGLPLPHPYDRGAAPAASSNRPPADDDGYRPPLKVALLLPASGPVSVAASAVRDGFMTAHFGEARRRPEVHAYDTADSAGGAVAAYKKAVADGNDFVVGPLGREQVAALFGLGEVPVPILALNRAATPAPAGSTSFSLAPEDEGVAAAERLLRRGLRRTIVFSARDDAATRALGAFRDTYTQRGGSIVAETVISDAGPNYGPILHDALAKAGDQYDAVFLVLKAPAARLLATQLSTNGFRPVPRVSTSLILSGGGNARLDQELDGIEFPELAWLLHPVGGLPDSSSIGSRLPSARGGGARLFAFGADAYRLSAYLEALAANPSSSVRGATGELRLDGLGNVQRGTDWAVFSGGRARAASEGGLQAEPPRGGTR